MFKFRHSGSFKKTENFLEKAKRLEIRNILNQYGQAGVDALSSATPIDTGETAMSWSYTVEVGKGKSRITWTNNHTEPGLSAPVAIILQYGHGTGTGGFVQGRNYINPAMQPIFDNIADQVWEEVTRI